MDTTKNQQSIYRQCVVKYEKLKIREAGPLRRKYEKTVAPFEFQMLRLLNL